MRRKNRGPVRDAEQGPRAPWRDFGDRSVPGKTLMPCYNPEAADDQWPDWKRRRDLDGWQGVPCWFENLTGQTVVTLTHDARKGLETRPSSWVDEIEQR